MRKQIRRRRDAQVRASAVCSQHSAIFDATPGGQSTRSTLETCVADTDRLLILQQESLQDRRAATEQLRARSESQARRMGERSLALSAQFDPQVFARVLTQDIPRLVRH